MRNINDYIEERITIIDENSNNANNPDTLKIQLKPHQLKLLYKCIELENCDIVINSNIIKTSIGIIADNVGSGKSYIILSIASNKIAQYNNLKIRANTQLLSIYYNISHDLIYKDINIIVVPHNIFNQWKEYINNTNLTAEYISSNKQLHNTLFDKQIILLSSTFYNKFATHIRIKKYIFSRIFFDEADSIKIPNCEEIKTYFTWFVTSSISNLIFPNGAYAYNENNNLKKISGIKHKGFIKNTFSDIKNLTDYFDITFSKYIFLKNSDSLIQKSLLMDDPLVFNIRCQNTKIINILKSLISESIQQMIYAGDIKSAINEINIIKTNETNLIKLVANDLLLELKNKEIDLESISKKIYRDINKQVDDINNIKSEINIINSKINDIKNRMNANNIDPITYEEINNLVILKCCKQSFDFESITSYITSNIQADITCPICRSIINNNDLIIVDNEATINLEPQPIDFKYSDKPHKLNNILNNNIQSNGRIIIYSQYSNTWIQIISILNNNNICYKELKGNNLAIDKIINWYKSNDDDKRVLLLNASYYGSGINLENTSDIILYHQMDMDLEKQVIGRAQRFGRMNKLNIWKLLYESE